MAYFPHVRQEQFGAPGNIPMAASTIVEFDNQRGFSRLTFQLVRPTGSLSLFQGTVDGTTWFNVFVTNETSGDDELAPTTDGRYKCSIEGLRKFRIWVILAGTADGTFIGTASSDNLATFAEAQDFYFEAAQGNIPGVTVIDKFGENEDIDTGTPEDVWAGGGLYTGFPSAAESVQVFSSSAADTLAGTGARTLQVFGLGADYVEKNETVNLNGTTPVTLTGTWLRINRAIVRSAGSGGENAGTITIRQTPSTANVFAQISPGNNQTTILAYTVPDGKTGYMRHININVGRTNGSTGSARVAIRAREENEVFANKRLEVISTSSPYVFDGPGALNFPARTDIVVRVLSVSGNNTQISGEFTMLLVDD